MNPTTSASALMDMAASHLRAAAEQADRQADADADADGHEIADAEGVEGVGRRAAGTADATRAADKAVGLQVTDGASSLWSGLAGQLRLVSAGVSPAARIAELTTRPVGIKDHLDAALTSLDRIAPLDGPPDLQLWAWRVVDLRAQLETMGSLL